MKKILVFLLFIFLCHNAFSQRYQKDDAEQMVPSPVKKQDSNKHSFHLPAKVFAGGSLGFLLGTTTYINLSPEIAYQIKPYLLLGVGGGYSYLAVKDRDPYTGAIIGREDFSIYDAKVLGMYTLPFLKNIFLETDLQATNVPDLSQPYFKDARIWLFSPLVGGGFRSQIGDKSFYYMQLLYDLNFNANAQIFTLTGSPFIIRGGILF